VEVVTEPDLLVQRLGEQLLLEVRVLLRTTAHVAFPGKFLALGNRRFREFRQSADFGSGRFERNAGFRRSIRAQCLSKNQGYCKDERSRREEERDALRQQENTS